MCDLTVIILTYNEEKNIAQAIESVKSIAKRIVVVDSFSTDDTVSIAKDLGAEVFAHEFINQAQQFTWALDNITVNSKWVLRLDADERLTEASAQEIADIIEENENTDVNGAIVRFNVRFLGRDLRHGGIYPFKKLCLFKYGKAHMENRNMDEHIVLDEGRFVELKSDSIHHDFKSLSAWIDKHNKYSSREILDYFQKSDGAHQSLSGSAKIKRFIKTKIYYKLPMGLRAWLYYVYRYYFRLGFLDGREGKIFCFLQAYWYRFLVDAKIYEKECEHRK